MDGYLNQKQRHPIALTAAIAINVAGVAAVWLAKSGVIVIEPSAIPIINIIDPTVPDPIDQAEPQDPPRRENPVYTPPRPIPDAPADETTILTGTSEPARGSGGTGSGPIAEPTPTPTPLPVLVDATPLASAARDFQPPYPVQLLRTGVEGRAVVRVLIGADGLVKQVAVIAADDPLFADATERQALRRWRFRPATRDGTPVESWKQLTVRFEIKS